MFEYWIWFWRFFACVWDENNRKKARQIQTWKKYFQQRSFFKELCFKIAPKHSLFMRYFKWKPDFILVHIFASHFHGFYFIYQKSLWMMIMTLCWSCLGQEAIVSEITRHTDPSGQTAFVHQKRRILPTVRRKQSK